MPADPVATTDASVRPPDLEPESVRGDERDVLAGWDVDADVAELTRWQADRPPFPTDTVVVLGAGAVGALAGAVVGTRRGRGALRGLTVGVLAAAVARRIWRLQD